MPSPADVASPTLGQVKSAWDLGSALAAAINRRATTPDLNKKQAAAFRAAGGEFRLLGLKGKNQNVRGYWYGGKFISREQALNIARAQMANQPWNPPQTDSDIADFEQSSGIEGTGVDVSAIPENPAPGGGDYVPVLPEYQEAFTTLPNLDVPVPVVAPIIKTGVGTVLGTIISTVGGILWPSETASPAQDLPPPPQPPGPLPPLPDWEDFTREPWLIPETVPFRQPYFPDPRPTAQPQPLPQELPRPSPPEYYPGMPVETVTVTAPRPPPIELPAPIDVPYWQPPAIEPPKPIPIPAPATLPRAPALPKIPDWLLPLLPWLSPVRLPTRTPPKRLPVPDIRIPLPDTVPIPDRPIPFPDPLERPYPLPTAIPYPTPGPGLPLPLPPTWSPPLPAIPTIPSGYKLPDLTPFRIPVVGSDPLNEFQPREADYDPCQAQATKPKRVRKPRKVCYSGTYVEKAFGLNKRRKRKIKCQ